VTAAGSSVRCVCDYRAAAAATPSTLAAVLTLWLSLLPPYRAGKSTLLRLIMGKEQANKGRVSANTFVL